MKNLYKISISLTGIILLFAAVEAQAQTYTYNTNLTIGSTGPEVIALQTFMVNNNYLVMPLGVSKGYFGNLTRTAVAKYQASNGISPSVGYFGPITRAKINSAAQTQSNITYPPGYSANAQIKINYSKCNIGTEYVPFAFGQTVFNFKGISNAKCNFQYGSEVENPMWDGAMSHSCSIPTSLGEKSYQVLDAGINMSELDSYCSKL